MAWCNRKINNHIPHNALPIFWNYKIAFFAALKISSKNPMKKLKCCLHKSYDLKHSFSDFDLNNKT